MKCPECGTKAEKEGKGEFKCPSCGWVGTSHKTRKLGRGKKPWRDANNSFTGPHVTNK